MGEPDSGSWMENTAFFGDGYLVVFRPDMTPNTGYLYLTWPDIRPVIGTPGQGCGSGFK
jgi:hypothetical protein